MLSGNEVSYKQWIFTYGIDRRSLYSFGFYGVTKPCRSSLNYELLEQQQWQQQQQPKQYLNKNSNNKSIECIKQFRLCFFFLSKNKTKKDSNTSMHIQSTSQCVSINTQYQPSRTYILAHMRFKRAILWKYMHILFHTLLYAVVYRLHTIRAHYRSRFMLIRVYAFCVYRQCSAVLCAHTQHTSEGSVELKKN